jgi:signal transduction histidine kinase
MRRWFGRFSTQVLLLQLGVLTVVCAAGLGLMTVLLRHDLIEQSKQRSLAIARAVAADDRYAPAVVSGDADHAVQPRAEAVRRRTGALFVVVTDKRGIRYSHPNRALLGQPVSPDQPQALSGNEVTTFGSSAAGRSARAKVPLRDASGEVIGEVIVAISADDINTRLLGLVLDAAGFLGIALGLGAAGAIALTRRVKRQTMGLEPAVLRLLFEQQVGLRRVATLVAGGASSADVFDLVVAEVAELLGAESTYLLRCEPDNAATVVASRAQAGTPLAVGTRLALGNDDLAAAVLSSGRAARLDGTQSGERSAQPFGARSAVAAPVVVEGDVWGVMVAGWSAPVAVSVETEERMAEFTELVATAIASANSQTELKASRARIVGAADHARQRIERDLHDGAQQRLVALGLELRVAQNSVPPGLDDLGAQLARAGTSLTEALADLHEISQGIHPAVLSKGGLGPALRALARRSAVPVELDMRAERRLAEPVEVAAYYVVSEALTNAAKHARATVVSVAVEVGDADLHVGIRDDGVGGADPSKGSGLTGLRDRVEALGGRLDFASGAGRGTSLTVTIPLDGG